jgi:hypothetical protein
VHTEYPYCWRLPTQPIIRNIRFQSRLRTMLHTSVYPFWVSVKKGTNKIFIPWSAMRRESSVPHRNKSRFLFFRSQSKVLLCRRL